MKKIMALLLYLLIVLSFASCSNEQDSAITLTDDSIEDYFEIKKSYEYTCDSMITSIKYTVCKVKITPKAGYIPDNVSFSIDMHSYNKDLHYDENNANGFGYDKAIDSTLNGKTIYGIGTHNVEFDSEMSKEIVFVASAYELKGYDSDFTFDYYNAKGIIGKKSY